MSIPYTPLHPHKDEIRLFKLFPNVDENARVQGSLEVVPLDEAPDFEALSYTWGDVTVTADITVADCIVGIPTNLEACLRALRHPTQERVCWIDYLCINQKDITGEKERQILLMGQIYTSASRVIAWLGESNPDIEEAVAYFNARQGEQTGKSAYWHEIWGKHTLSIQEEQEKYLAMISASIGNLDILSAPYWQRLWTFQEWHLPKEKPICMSGRITFRMENLLQSGVYCHPPESDWINVVRQGLNDDTKANFTVIEQRLEVFREKKLRPFLGSIPEDIVEQRIFRPDPNSAPECGIGDLLSATLHRKCTQPLDRIYALYSMTPQARERYPPNYAKPLNQVMHETTAYIINYEKDWKIFENFEFSKDESSPSWVLDFATMSQGRRLHMRNAYYKHHLPETALLGVEEGHLPTVADNLSTLHLHCQPVGAILDRIYQLSDQLVTMLAEVQVIANIFKKANRSSYDRDGLAETWLRACYNYTDSHDSFSFEFLVELMEKDLVESREDFCDAAGDLLVPVVEKFSALTGKYFFVVTTGVGFDTIGIADCEVKHKDALMFASGISQVLIMRRCPESGNDECRIVGRAFVEGLFSPPGSEPTPLVEDLKSWDLRRVAVR
ncbi:hypothetical protein AbraIFM66951_003382 [Aspergillus brasiliensis]|uniref:Heterokaryon incompatibility domain-containing protein n=1 Tax=Aspergillus brasiliensis TaxID=319629 RepID=A0A9W6DKX2_9EURO|nr:hypothetical protein AbraCBS73388_001426 [Aspergillus brasiliensis]GKZ43019.1 hypothetical protein AbraIFM66951_003382 [Aspergillus brasiliensis]